MISMFWDSISYISCVFCGFPKSLQEGGEEDIGAEACIEYVSEVADFAGGVVPEDAPVSVGLVAPGGEGEFLAVERVLGAVFTDDLEAFAGVGGVAERFVESLGGFQDAELDGSEPLSEGVASPSHRDDGSAEDRDATIQAQCDGGVGAVGPLFLDDVLADGVGEQGRVWKSLVERAVERIGAAKRGERKAGEKLCEGGLKFGGSVPFSETVVLSESRAAQE